MINITFNPSSYELKVEGHADFGKKGEDIVCSAVSILFYTLAQALYDSQEMLIEHPIVDEADGNGHISCRPKKEYEGNIARSYWTILNGFQLIADTYKDNVKFSVLGN